MKADKALEVYLDWYATLLVWAAVLTTLEQAKMAVRRALALTFLDACNGLETEEGPYIRSVDHLNAIMQRGMMLTTPANYHKLFRDLPRPCDQQMYEMSMLYAGCYVATFEARLSLNDRTHLYMLLQGYSPVHLDTDTLNERVQALGSSDPSFRRVVEATEKHTCDGRLICEASDYLWRTEHEKSRRWFTENSV